MLNVKNEARLEDALVRYVIDALNEERIKREFTVGGVRIAAELLSVLEASPCCMDCDEDEQDDDDDDDDECDDDNDEYGGEDAAVVKDKLKSVLKKLDSMLSDIAKKRED